MGYGISCLSCGLWLGAGTLANDHGGYFKLWNTAPRGERTCRWIEYKDGTWYVACVNSITGPSPLADKPCQYCGKPVELVTYQEDAP